MITRRLCLFLSLVAACLALGCVNIPAFAADSSEIRLLVRGDDIGSSHAANVACIEAYRDGIQRSVEIMVSAPWFNEAVEMLAENPGLDVGVHLTLTSEWSNCKWGPLTEAPSLVDRQGHFPPTTRRWGDEKGPKGFLDIDWKIEEVERELRAQIELAVEKIDNVTHLTCHMGTASSTPELRSLVDKLAAEYKLPVRLDGAGRTPRFGGKDVSAEQKEANLAKILEDLKPGLWLIVEHPGLDTPEMRAIGHPGYENVAADRDGVTKAFTSDKVKEVIERRGIRLVSYGDIYRERQANQ